MLLMGFLSGEYLGSVSLVEYLRLEIGCSCLLLLLILVKSSRNILKLMLKYLNLMSLIPILRLLMLDVLLCVPYLLLLNLLLLVKLILKRYEVFVQRNPVLQQRLIP